MAYANAQDKLKALMAQRRAQKEAASAPAPASIASSNSTPSDLPHGMVDDPYQARAVELALSGKSFVITGPAGSGKSTTFRRILNALQSQERIEQLGTVIHKHLQSGRPSVIITSFTNRAVENDKNILGSAWDDNCLTIHKLLEYEPVEFITEEGKTSMRFEPKRCKQYPLPSSITHIVIEEATLVNVPLWNLVWDAIMTTPVQFIFVGDIQQLPPVFGKPIFIHAMQRGLPIVELKNVYRQALESPILALAHRILSGKPIPAAELPEWNRTSETTGSKLQVRTWPMDVPEIRAIVMMQKWLPQQIDAGKLDPMNDIILTPVGKAGRFGSTELNKIVAHHLAKKGERPVWEVYTGLSKKYFSIGDRVVVDKHEAIITYIKPNLAFYGKSPRKPSLYMDYNGVISGVPDEVLEAGGLDDEGDGEDLLEEIDTLFESLGSHVADGDKVSRAASHSITVRFTDGVNAAAYPEYMIDPNHPDYDSRQDPRDHQTLSGAGEINNMSLGYSTSVHKSQGSEWSRVFLMLHSSQNMMLFRELLYTAVTRASRELVIVCESNAFVRGISTQRLPGLTLEDKLAKFEEFVAKQHRVGKGNTDEIPVGLDTLLRRNATV